MKSLLAVRLRRSSGRAPLVEHPAIPVDPKAVLATPLDPVLESIRAGLRPHRRRLWLRRIVRRTWLAVAAAAVAEAMLFGLARLTPIELLPTFAVAIPVVGLLGLVVASGRARPSLGETAIAIDAEGHLGDRIATALALAVANPAAAGPVDEEAAAETSGEDQDALEAERFVRRQRADAARSVSLAPPSLFRPRLARNPAIAAAVATLLLVPLVLLPNSQDAAIARAQSVRQEAQEQAERIDEIARDLESQGKNPDDPRTRLAQELRDLARQLRERPQDLELNLAKVSSVESDVRSQLDPANEQRASSLASLSRSLSRAASGQQNANKGGDPKEASKDLKKLGDKLPSLTPEERRKLASALSELQSTASQASGAAGTALRDAAQSLAQGQDEAAREALERLAEALEGADSNVDVNRDLARAASGLQDSRRNLANSGQQGQQGQQGQGQAQAGQAGQGQQGQQGQNNGQPCPTTAPVKSGETPAPTPRCVNAPNGQQGQGGQPGQGQGGQGQGGQPGQGSQGQGAPAGGGSNAASLGQGTSGGGPPGRPTNPNRPAELGEDLSSVFAPFDRLGKPGDPSYVAGTGGDGQTQEGNQTGQGENNGAFTPYEEVYTDFYDYALTTLDRNYVPLSVKDFVRDYFSSLDPAN